jgi:hypothetical protein
MTSSGNKKLLQYSLDDLFSLCSEDEIQSYLGIKGTKLDELRKPDPANPFSWMQGVHWFQAGRVIRYNRKMIGIWLIAKNQNDAQMHLNAIDAFQKSIPGSEGTFIRRAVENRC